MISYHWRIRISPQRRAYSAMCVRRTDFFCNLLVCRHFACIPQHEKIIISHKPNKKNNKAHHNSAPLGTLEHASYTFRSNAVTLDSSFFATGAGPKVIFLVMPIVSTRVFILRAENEDRQHSSNTIMSRMELSNNVQGLEMRRAESKRLVHCSR